MGAVAPGPVPQPPPPEAPPSPEAPPPREPLPRGGRGWRTREETRPGPGRRPCAQTLSSLDREWTPPLLRWGSRPAELPPTTRASARGVWVLRAAQQGRSLLAGTPCCSPLPRTWWPTAHFQRVLGGDRTAACLPCPTGCGSPGAGQPRILYPAPLAPGSASAGVQGGHLSTQPSQGLSGWPARPWDQGFCRLLPSSQPRSLTTVVPETQGQRWFPVRPAACKRWRQLPGGAACGPSRRPSAQPT